MESDDVDIDFSYKATDGIKEQPTKPVVVKPVNADVTGNEIVSHDDIDIDNIWVWKMKLLSFYFKIIWKWIVKWDLKFHFKNSKIF